MEARDLAAVVDAFAADAVFRSPLTTRLAFTGHEQIGALLQVLFEVLQDLQFGPDGKIGEFTVFFRPLPAAALALRLIAAGLVRRKSPARAVVVFGLTRPLGS
jgi:hypothetical protein